LGVRARERAATELGLALLLRAGDARFLLRRPLEEGGVFLFETRDPALFAINFLQYFFYQQQTGC
jgi:hypothetical protein